LPNMFAEIAEVTGGMAFHDNNNLLIGLQGAFRRWQDDYRIAYVSRNGNPDGKFRGYEARRPAYS